MRPTVALLALAAALTGCAASIIDTNPRSVVLRAGTAMSSSATQTAQAECQRHGRNARLNQRDGNVWHFDCV